MVDDVWSSLPGRTPKTPDRSRCEKANDALLRAMWQAEGLVGSQFGGSVHATRIIHGSDESRGSDPAVKSCQPEREPTLNGGRKRPPLSVEQWTTLGEEISRCLAVVFVLGSEAHDTAGGLPTYRLFAKCHTAIGHARGLLDDMMYAQHPGKFQSNNPFYCSDFTADPTETMAR